MSNRHPLKIGRRLLIECAVVAVTFVGQGASAQTAEEQLMAARAKIIHEVPKAQRKYLDKIESLGGVPAINPRDAAKGDWGKIESNNVYDGTRTQMGVNGPITVTVTKDHVTSFKVDEVVDKRTVIIFGYYAWLEGVDASSLADESQIELRGLVFECRGNKSYETAIGGNRTVKYLVAIDIGKALAAGAELHGLREFREWKDDNGKHSILAKFIDYKAGNVTLQQIGGSTITVRMARLSKDDQRRIQAIVKARKPARQ
jgi:hypothetical protein